MKRLTMGSSTQFSLPQIIAIRLVSCLRSVVILCLSIVKFCLHVSCSVRYSFIVEKGCGRFNFNPMSIMVRETNCKHSNSLLDVLFCLDLFHRWAIKEPLLDWRLQT